MDHWSQWPQQVPWWSQWGSVMPSWSQKESVSEQLVPTSLNNCPVGPLVPTSLNKCPVGPNLAQWVCRCNPSRTLECQVGPKKSQWVSKWSQEVSVSVQIIPTSLGVFHFSPLGSQYMCNGSLVDQQMATDHDRFWRIATDCDGLWRISTDFATYLNEVNLMLNFDQLSCISYCRT